MSSVMSLSQHRARQEPTPNLWEADVDKVINRLKKRSLHCGWHVPWCLYTHIEETWEDHAGPLQPTGLRITLGHGLFYNWQEVLRWIGDEAKQRGLGLNTDFTLTESLISFYPGSEVTTAVSSTTVVRLDISKYWNRDDGLKVGAVRSPNVVWPGLEVAWLLALNPDYLFAMDGERFPYLTLPGLQVGNGGVPCIGRGNSGVFVYGTSQENPRAGAIPSFR